MNFSDFKPKYFDWRLQDGVGVVTLNRPEKKNPLTFESYAELRDTFLALKNSSDVKAVIITGAGENFCSGGDVHEIIGPLTKMNDQDLLKFTTMTGDLIKAIRGCPQPIISAIDGICVGAGACVAMASDMRIGTERTKIAFLFVRVGLAGCDMGACAMLPRIVGQGRASEMLFTGRSIDGKTASEWGFLNKMCSPERLMEEATELARTLATGPTAAHAVTKKMLDLEWNMPLDEAITAEAKAQAECMKTMDFKRAYEAFVNKAKPIFKGN